MQIEKITQIYEHGFPTTVTVDLHQDIISFNDFTEQFKANYRLKSTDSLSLSYNPAVITVKLKIGLPPEVVIKELKRTLDIVSKYYRGQES